MKFALAFALVFVLALAQPIASAARTIESPVYLHELSFGLHVVPDSMNAESGDTLKFTVTNQGTEKANSKHDLVVCGDALDRDTSGKYIPPNPCNEKLGFTKLLANNESAILTAVLPHGGTMSYYCDLPSHASLGMFAILNVSGAGASKPSPGIAVFGTLIALGAVALFRRK